MDRLTEILNKGIEEKRNGNYSNALNYYNKAQEINPLDLRIYGNKMKLLIGSNKYEEAFRNILILCHDNIANDYFSQDPMGMATFQNFLPRFNTPAPVLNKTQKFDPVLIMDAASADMRLVDLIYRADNLTFHGGHCYVGESTESNEFFESLFKDREFEIHFNNFNKTLLGQQSGIDYRNTNIDGYFLCIGFIYIHMNLNLNLGSKQQMIEYYLNLNIRKDIWNYNEFLNL